MTMERGSLVNKRYRIVEILGQGGMAAVYRAIDENLGTEVALKENLFTTEEYARQFRLEATILASLRQPNLPRVSDHFVIEQLGQYLVMDYIEGEDLRQRMDRLGQLPEQEVIVVGVAISDALLYMHSRKPMVLHRDIKPGNVRITPTGHIYLVDFGLAKIVQGRETTSTGARAMTPGYSPPEQYGTARTDHRSDIYSLGATLYSALTDQLPEDGLARAMGQAKLTPVIKHNSRVSQALAQVIEKCLEVRPDDRYQSAEELRLDLLNARSTTRRKLPIELVLPPPPITLTSKLPGDDAELDELYPPAQPGPGGAAGGGMSAGGKLANAAETPSVKRAAIRRRRTLGWVIGGFLLFMLILGLIGTLQNGGLPAWLSAVQPPEPTQGALVDNLPTDAILPTVATPTPDGGLVVTLQPSATRQAPLQPSQTPQPSPTSSPAPTPMGGGVGQIAFVSDRTGAAELYLINVDGSGLTQLTFIPEGVCQPRWSPDGERLVFISPCSGDYNQYNGSSLFLLDIDGGSIVPLPSAPGGDFDPSWSPDGSQIVFTSLRGGGVPSIYILNLSNNQVTRIGDATGRYNANPAWSPNGTAIAYVGADYRLYAMAPDGTVLNQLVVGAGEYYSSDPIWAPDGSWLVFSRVAVADTSGISSLWAVEFSLEGAIAVEVRNSTLAIDPSFSPDGFWMAFKSWESGSHDIYLMRSNGVNREPLVTDPAYDFDPAWRP